MRVLLIDLYDTGDVDDTIDKRECEALFVVLVKRLFGCFGYNVCFLLVRLRSLRESYELIKFSSVLMCLLDL